MVIEWHLFPVITGLMVTTNPDRHTFAVESAKDFVAQQWLHKELIVVNTTARAFPKLKGVFELVARKADNLRDFGLAQCRGEWIADWQDDCRYSPAYLHALARLRSREKRVSLTGHRGICLDDGTVVNVNNDGVDFSLVFRYAAKVNGPPNWLDKRELATRYYASKAVA